MKKSNAPHAVVMFASINPENPTTETTSSAPAKDQVTMNGYTFAEADTMVKSFIRNPTLHDPYTSFWFKKDYIREVDAILNAANNPENLDGFRIYFGKHSGKNTIVMVATRQTQTPHPNYRISVRSQYTHEDVFDFQTNYFNNITDEVRGEAEHRENGARLFGEPGTECTNVICTSIANAVTCEEAKQWVHRTMSTANRPINITSVWYPKSFFSYWNRELHAANQGDGIRIYFAEKQVGGLPKSTCVITTTRVKDNQARTDYFECYLAAVKSGLGDPLDNGEECPINCYDVTWPE